MNKILIRPNRLPDYSINLCQFWFEERIQVNDDDLYEIRIHNEKVEYYSKLWEKWIPFEWIPELDNIYKKWFFQKEFNRLLLGENNNEKE